MRVQECMKIDPITITPKATYAQAFRLLSGKELHALPVVDKKGQLVGIVTEKDLLDISPVAVLAVHTTDDLFSAVRVEEAMTRQVFTVQQDCALEEAARILVDNKISSLPVMHGDHLVGLLTEKDILRTMMDTFGERSEGLHITIRLLEDKGELGAITDGIIQSGGRLISLCTFWGDEPFKRVITLKVQGIDREELLKMLEWNIGVQVIDCWGSSAEAQPEESSSATNLETFPIENLDTKTPWPLDLK